VNKRSNLQSCYVVVVVSLNMALMSQTRNVLWPEFADEKSATIAVRRVSNWVFVWSALCVAIGLLDLIVSISLVGNRKASGGGTGTEFVWYIIVEGLVYGVIAWRIRNMSVSWALVGLVISVVGALAVLRSPFAFILYAFLVLAFISALRAINKQRRIALSAQ
jgi:hypothetical protein